MEPSTLRILRTIVGWRQSTGKLKPGLRRWDPDQM